MGSSSPPRGGRRELGAAPERPSPRVAVHPPRPDPMMNPRPAPRTVLCRRLTALVAVLVGALGIALWSAGAASAHAELLGVTPADGSVVQDPPATVEVRFSEAISLTGGSARV